MAVHTKLSEANIRKVVEDYELGNLVNFSGIKEGIENTNYLIKTEDKKFIITIFEQRVDTSNLPFYFEVMVNSKSAGIECPTPIKNIKGEYTDAIKEKKMAVFNFLSGSSKRKWTKIDCFKVGEKLAIFHLANSKNKLFLKNQFGINFWNKTFTNCRKRLNKLIPNCVEIIEKEFFFVSKNWPKNLPAGVIHADLFPDNVFFENNSISGFLDFYFSCNDFLSYDLAISINAWCFNDMKFNKDFFLSLLSGYESIRKLNKEEKKSMNILLRGASLRFFLTRAHDSIFGKEGKYLEKKDPKEFFDILNFHISINSNEFYFD